MDIEPIYPTLQAAMEQMPQAKPIKKKPAPRGRAGNSTAAGNSASQPAATTSNPAAANGANVVAAPAAAPKKTPRSRKKAAPAPAPTTADNDPYWKELHGGDSAGGAGGTSTGNPLLPPVSRNRKRKANSPPAADQAADQADATPAPKTKTTKRSGKAPRGDDNAAYAPGGTLVKSATATASKPAVKTRARTAAPSADATQAAQGSQASQAPQVTVGGSAGTKVPRKKPSGSEFRKQKADRDAIAAASAARLAAASLNLDGTPQPVGDEDEVDKGNGKAKATTSTAAPAVIFPAQAAPPTNDSGGYHQVVQHHAQVGQHGAPVGQHNAQVGNQYTTEVSRHGQTTPPPTDDPVPYALWAASNGGKLVVPQDKVTEFLTNSPGMEELIWGPRLEGTSTAAAAPVAPGPPLTAIEQQQIVNCVKTLSGNTGGFNRSGGINPVPHQPVVRAPPMAETRPAYMNTLNATTAFNVSNAINPAVFSPPAYAAPVANTNPAYMVVSSKDLHDLQTATTNVHGEDLIFPTPFAARTTVTGHANYNTRGMPATRQAHSAYFSVPVPSVAASSTIASPAETPLMTPTTDTRGTTMSPTIASETEEDDFRWAIEYEPVDDGKTTSTSLPSQQPSVTNHSAMAIHNIINTANATPSAVDADGDSLMQHAGFGGAGAEVRAGATFSQPTVQLPTAVSPQAIFGRPAGGAPASGSIGVFKDWGHLCHNSATQVHDGNGTTEALASATTSQPATAQTQPQNPTTVASGAVFRFTAGGTPATSSTGNFQGEARVSETSAKVPDADGPATGLASPSPAIAPQITTDQLNQQDPTNDGETYPTRADVIEVLGAIAMVVDHTHTTSGAPVAIEQSGSGGATSNCDGDAGGAGPTTSAAPNSTAASSTKANTTSTATQAAPLLFPDVAFPDASPLRLFKRTSLSFPPLRGTEADFGVFYATWRLFRMFSYDNWKEFLAVMRGDLPMYTPNTLFKVSFAILQGHYLYMGVLAVYEEQLKPAGALPRQPMSFHDFHYYTLKTKFNPHGIPQMPPTAAQI